MSDRMRPWRRRPDGRLRIIGHRGVRGTVAENTMSAFAAAANQGADAVELDVRVCASGELVVAHDPSLARVTGGRDERAIASLPHQELCKVDVGGGERPPLLREVLAFARDRRLGVNIEM